MKYLSTLFLATLAFANPEDPPVVPKTKTPVGCRAMITDETYPSPEVWKKELPTSEMRNVDLEGDGHTEYKIRPSTYQEVVEAVKFSSKHNLRLSIMNSGHDFVGRNDAPTGLLIDTGALRGIHVLEEFVPTEKGADKPGETVNVIVPKPGKQAAVTIGVGISTQMLNDALDKSKLVTVGAAHGSVAPAGGFGQTGGHSPISDLYGLGSDNLLELQVVTADGTLRIANKVSNPDLYWALRGGGGSTFGVVVQATVKAHPTIPVTAVSWTLNSTTGVENPGIWEAYAALHRMFPDWADNKGVSGYYYHYGNRIGSIFLHKGEHSNRVKVEALWKPALETLEKLPNVKMQNFTIVEHPTFKSYFDSRFGAIDRPGAPRGEAAPWEQKGGRFVDGMYEPFVLTKRHEPEQTYEASQPKPPVGLDSRLLGKEHFESKNLTAALRAAFPTVQGFPPLIQGHLIGGNKASISLYNVSR
jgi:FAD/FMN-containing dehydrogenase